MMTPVTVNITATATGAATNRKQIAGIKNQRRCAVVYYCCGLSFAKHREPGLHVPPTLAAFASRKVELEIRIT